MTKASIDQYILAVRNGIETSKFTVVIEGRVLDIRFNAEAIKLEGKIVASFSQPGGKINVRIAYYDYAGNRKDSITLKDMDSTIVCSQIINFVEHKAAEIKKIDEKSIKFRTELWKKHLEPLGFSRECDSKYLTVFSKNGTHLNIKFSGEAFIGEITTSRKKSHIYRFNGDIANDDSYKRIEMALKLLTQKH